MPRSLIGEALLIGFPEYRGPAQRLARALGLSYAEAEIHRFPDGESRLCLPERVPEHVILCRTLDRPNDKLVDLILAAGTARRLGAGRITLVAPYLCYMRQDKAFHPGEAISQQIIGSLLANWIDTLVTVDPHLHRIDRLEEAVPAEQTVVVTAADSMSAFLLERLENPFLIGPDEESEQWVSAIARQSGLEFCVGRKERLGDHEVRMTLPSCNYQGRNIVLVDDVVSTGHTLDAAVKALVANRPASISILVTHALFVDDALERLQATRVGKIWSSDSIPHSTNCLQLADLLALAAMGPGQDNYIK